MGELPKEQSEWSGGELYGRWVTVEVVLQGPTEEEKGGSKSDDMKWEEG